MSEQIVPGLRGWKNSAIFPKTHEYLGHIINEKSIAVDALSRYTDLKENLPKQNPLKPLEEGGFPPLIPLSILSPIEETDQLGLQDPPSLARLGGLDAPDTDVFEEGGLRNPQVFTGFLGR